MLLTVTGFVCALVLHVPAVVSPQITPGFVVREGEDGKLRGSENEP